MHEETPPQATGLHQLLPATDPAHQMARPSLQPGVMSEDKAAARHHHQEPQVEVDWTHPTSRTQQHPTTCAGLEPRGKPYMTWRRSLDADLKTICMTWGLTKQTAQDRVRWRRVVKALCSSGSHEVGREVISRAKTTHNEESLAIGRNNAWFNHCSHVCLFCFMFPLIGVVRCPNLTGPLQVEEVGIMSCSVCSVSADWGGLESFYHRATTG